MKKFIKEILSSENLKNAMAGMSFMQPNSYVYLNSINKNNIK